MSQLARTSRPTKPHTGGATHEDAPPGRGGPSLLLKLTLLAVLCVPAYLVVDVIGATGNVPHLLALLLFAAWAAASAFGLHDPLPYGHPGRAGSLFWIFASLASYVAMFGGFSGDTDAAGRSAADRWILLLLSASAVTFATTESLRHTTDLKELLRWVMGGAAFCSVVAAFQFIGAVNPVDWFESAMVGFTNGGSGSAFQAREPFQRVSGTTMHPIELAAVSAMLLPLALWWALFDVKVARVWRMIVPVLLLAANVFTISRTGMLGLTVCVLVFIPFLPRLARQWALVISPLALVAVFLAIPGMVATMFQSATVGTDDTSITYRLDDYPMAWRLFIERPLFGMGPGSWLPTHLKDVYDNAYLFTSTTLGGLGIAALLAYLLLPMLSALSSARHTTDLELRTLGGALTAGMLTASLTAATFDAFSFQTFVFVLAFMIGLTGFLWLAVTAGEPGTQRTLAASPATEPAGRGVTEMQPRRKET